MASTKVLVTILVFCVFVLVVFTMSFFITGMPTVNIFTKPDFERYPDLVLRNKNMEILDFSEERKATYYYNIVGTRLPFSMGERNFFLEVKDVAFDKLEEEYATVEIRSSGITIYEYLYVNKEVGLDFYGEELKLVAESIIDGDNIEYLTVRGVDEEPEPVPQVGENGEEETGVDRGLGRNEPPSGQRMHEEGPRKVVNPAIAWLVAILGTAGAFFILIMLVVKGKKPRVFRREF